MIERMIPDDPHELIPWSVLGLFALLAYDETTAGNVAFLGLAGILGGFALNEFVVDRETTGLEEEPTTERRRVEGTIGQLIGPDEMDRFALPDGLKRRLGGSETVAVVDETADPRGLEWLVHWLTLGAVGGPDLRDRPVVLLDRDLAAIVDEGDDVVLDVEQVVVPLERTFAVHESEILDDVEHDLGVEEVDGFGDPAPSRVATDGDGPGPREEPLALVAGDTEDGRESESDDGGGRLAALFSDGR